MENLRFSNYEVSKALYSDIDPPLYNTLRGGGSIQIQLFTYIFAIGHHCAYALACIPSRKGALVGPQAEFPFKLLMRKAGIHSIHEDDNTLRARGILKS